MLEKLIEFGINIGPIWFRVFSVLLLIQVVAWLALLPFMKKSTATVQTTHSRSINIGSNVNTGNQIFITGNNNQIIVPSQPVPSSAKLPLWRTLDLSAQPAPPFGIQAIKLVFGSEGGTIQGIVKVQGENQLYHFDTASNPEVSIPLPRERRVLEFAIMNASSENTKYSVMLKGFEFGDDFFRAGMNPQNKANKSEDASKARQSTQEAIAWDYSGYFLGMSAVGGSNIHISSFQLKGKNISGEPIKQIKGVLRSNVTNEEIPILLESMPPEETNGIPVDCEFWLRALFRDPTAKREGIPEDKFLKQFGDFTLVLSFDGKMYQRKFSYNEVSALIDKFRKESNPPPKPTVTRKVAS